MRWYIYCLSTAPLADGPEGLAGRSVAAMEEDGLYLILSPWQGEAPRLEPAFVLTHERVVEAAMRGGVVLPFRFGTVVDEAVCRDFVREHRTRIDERLKQVAGRVEVSLKLIEPPSPSPPPVREEVRSGLEYLLQRQRAVRRQEERESHAREMVARVEAALEPWIVARHHRLVPSDRVLATVTHLIPQESLWAWREAVAGLRPHLEDLDCLASGPWPPYHFAEVIAE